MTAFDPHDPTTWPQVMTADEIAAIYRRSVGGVRKACQLHTFIPAPYKTHPYRWRKSDVVRDIRPVAVAV